MVNPWTVNLSPEAKKRLEKLPNPDRRRILTALDVLHIGPSGNIKPLKGRSDKKPFFEQHGGVAGLGSEPAGHPPESD